MRKSATALQNYLFALITGGSAIDVAGGFPYKPDLYTIMSPDGSTVLTTFTNFDQSISYTWAAGYTVPAGTYTYGSIYEGMPKVTRTTWKQTNTLEVSSMEVDIAAAQSVQINGAPFLAALLRGDLDDAWVSVDRAFMLTPGNTSMGTVNIFAGRLFDGEIKDRISCTLTLKSELILLDAQTPRTLISSGCNNQLFDGLCTLSQASYTSSGSVTSATRFSITATIPAPPAAGSPGSWPPSISAPPSVAPTLSDSGAAGLALPEATYYVVTTYVSALGETTKSPQAFRVVTRDRLLNVSSPPSVAGALGWNVYVATDTGDNVLQNLAPIAIGTGWQQSPEGMTQGVPPPSSDTLGYYAFGMITFTSGVLSGISAKIESNNGGVLNLTVPLIVAPAIGDTFKIIPGCDLMMLTCNQKYNNLIHFRGYPFVPQPETAF